MLVVCVRAGLRLPRFVEVAELVEVIGVGVVGSVVLRSVEVGPELLSLFGDGCG